MTKRDDIDQLRHDYAMLARRVEALEQQVGQRDPNHKSYKQIQDDWHAQHSDMLPRESRLDKGPVPFSTGCASIAGYAGSHPATIRCKGKGAITGQGSAPVAGGGFSIQADCGDGFEYQQTGDPK